MEISISGQAISILKALALGFVLGSVFDVFRIFRVAHKSGTVSVFFQDVLFWFVCAAATFIFLLFETDGMVRFILLTGEFSGFFVYYRTIGRLTNRLAKRFDHVVKRAARRSAGKIAKPVKKAGGYLGGIIVKGGRKSNSLIKKESKVFKIRLKVYQKMLYNLIQSKKKNKASGK